MKTILVFANGAPVEADLIATLRYDLLYCADGGATQAMALGLKPDLIAGDLDSIDHETLKQAELSGIPLRRFPRDKDLTDLELCLLEAVKLTPFQILIVGALGLRVDQHLSNLLLLTRPQFNGIRIGVIDTHQSIWILRAGESIELIGKQGDLLSIIPVSERVLGVNADGTFWPLKAAALELGDSRTVSNVFLGSCVRVSISSGLCLIIHIAPT
ncbi:MAG: thiamine diphosphokinase [Oligoflexia bacterium]|nr:thiamine diphosphokinase [Oligoflexia bacterium]